VDDSAATSLPSPPDDTRKRARAGYTRDMPTLLTRIVGLLLLTLAISVSSCQAVFPDAGTVNAPQQLNPGSFTDGR
jgi:hypothetical protein